MKTPSGKRFSLAFSLLLMALVWVWAQTPAAKSVKLNEPNKKRGLPVMEALSLRASVREWSERDLTLQDLSDVLWAANGINRPDSRKRTAASAMNAQDVDVYVFLKDGAYVYDPAQHILTLVAQGDLRSELMMMRPGGGPGGPPGAKPEAAPGAKPEGPPVAKPEGVPAGPPPGPPPGGGQPSPAPVQLILVSDASRFARGTPELKYEWGAIDTGLVAENIALFCAGTGLATRPRASINQERIKSILKLTETQHAFLNLPVGYPK